MPIHLHAETLPSVSSAQALALTAFTNFSSCVSHYNEFRKAVELIEIKVFYYANR